VQGFRPAPDGIGFTTDEAHVWLVSTESDFRDLGRLENLLSPDETERAGRFHFEKDRRAFIMGRGVLRLLLGRYTGREPASLRFVYSSHGKPALPGTGFPENPAFSVSHSGTKILLAFSPGHSIGVDIEHIRRSPELEDLARRYFSPAESDLFLSLPEKHRTEAFFICWVRKEAFLKAHGQGLSFGLDRFEVSLRPGEQARLIRIRDNETEAREWILYDLPTGPEYKAALAARAHPGKICCYIWPAGTGVDDF
jgi:4'-phosphopantetheinyl transferase